jgi:hypothetical protein
VIRQSGDGGGLDLLAVQRDDELLDLLGARGAVPGSDEVARLLAALTAEVDDALPADPVRTDAGPTAPAAGTPGHTRRFGAAGVAAAVLLGGSVALSGAAAAVTGDPLAPYKTVGHAVGTVSSAVGSAVGQALSFGEDDLPEQAAPIAHLNKRLSGARAALAHGDATQVRALVDELTAVLATADLSDEQRAALQQRLDRLEDALAKAAPAPQVGTAKGGGKAATDTAPKDKAPADTAPKDKAPADKAPADKTPADKAPADKAPGAGGSGTSTDSDTTGDTDSDSDTTSDSDPTSDVTQQQVPTPKPQATGGSGGGGRGSGSQQSTELDAASTEQRGQGASRR